MCWGTQVGLTLLMRLSPAHMILLGCCEKARVLSGGKTGVWASGLGRDLDL